MWELIRTSSLSDGVGSSSDVGTTLPLFVTVISTLLTVSALNVTAIIVIGSCSTIVMTITSDVGANTNGPSSLLISGDVVTFVPA